MASINTTEVKKKNEVKSNIETFLKEIAVVFGKCSSQFETLRKTLTILISFFFQVINLTSNESVYNCYQHNISLILKTNLLTSNYSGFHTFNFI